MSLLTQDDLAEMKSAAMQCQSQDDYIRAIEAAVVKKLAVVSVEPVGEVLRIGRDSRGRPWHEIYWYAPNVDEPNGTKLHTATQLAAARVQAIEEAAKVAADSILHIGGDKETAEYLCKNIRTLIAACNSLESK